MCGRLRWTRRSGRAATDGRRGRHPTRARSLIPDREARPTRRVWLSRLESAGTPRPIRMYRGGEPRGDADGSGEAPAVEAGGISGEDGLRKVGRVEKAGIVQGLDGLAVMAAQGGARQAGHGGEESGQRAR